MNKNKISLGIDIGTTKIVAIIGKKNEYGKIEIIGIGKSPSLGVYQGVVSNITQTVESIQLAVERAFEASGVEIREGMVGIAGKHIKSLQHNDYINRKNPEKVISDSDIENLVKQVYNLSMLPGEKIIHVLPQEYKIDGQSEITEALGMYGNRLEANFHVVTGQISSISNIMRCVKSAGLIPKGVTLEPIASSESVLSQDEKEAGVALIDIGGGTTDLAIFKNGIIRHTVVIPFGGNIVTEDIKEGCSIIGKYAEELKIRFGSTWPNHNKENEIVTIPGLNGREPKEISLKTLSKIIHARIKEIIETVYIEIENYGHNEQRKKLIGGIVITGGGSQIKHLKQLVEYVTGMDTRIGVPNEHIAGDSEQHIASPIYSTAVGLLMKAIEENEKEERRSDEEKTANDSMEELHKNRINIFEVWTEKLIKFFDREE